MPIASHGPPPNMCDVTEASMRRGVRYCADEDIVININNFNPSGNPTIADGTVYDTDRQFAIEIGWGTGDIKTALPAVDSCTCSAGSDDIPSACANIEGSCLACDVGSEAPQCSE